MVRSFDEYKKLVEDNLLGYMPHIDPLAKTLYDSMAYSLIAGGKRLRPVLLLASCELAGGDAESVLPYACAMEYIHTYSLIHDDLPAMDDDELRRGKPTNHMVYGAGIATLAGDGLLSSAFEIMYRDMYLYFDKKNELKNRVKAAYAISKGAGVRGMVAGQTADLEGETKDPTPEFLDFIHMNKTCAMIVGAVTAGQYLGNADDSMLKSMTSYAECLGLSFQIADDILDIVGTKEELGKNPGVDEEAGKMTYPALYGLDESRKRLHDLTEKAVSHLSEIKEDTAFFEKLVRKLETRTK